MNRDLANIIKGFIEGEPWVDRISGIVRPLTRAHKRGEKTTLITVPVACGIPDADCDEGVLKNLVPDSSKRSIIYFEDKGSYYDSRDAYGIRWRSMIRMVVWLNLKKFAGTSCDLSGLILQNIIALINEDPINSAPYLNIRITTIGQPAKLKDIFSAYSYKEEVIQYLAYPYDYFAVDFEVKYTMNKNCINEIQLDDQPC